MPKLLVQIGPDRFHLETAHVNNTTRPTEIATDRFVGRVLVRVKDFVGVTPDGSSPVKDDPYFDGRGRKFSIQLEGRFLERPGVAPYTADEIHFGSDFDHMVPESQFPSSAFNAGMKVAQWVDPSTFFEIYPPNGRPYIMSPYAACMNTVAAWPAPSRAADSVVALRHTEQEEEGAAKHGDEDVPPGAEDLVPVEVLDANGKKKAGRHLRRYWRFIGLKTDPKVQDYLKAHAPHLLNTPSADPSIAAPRPTFSHRASLGMLPRSDSPDSYSASSVSTSSAPPSSSSSTPPPKKTSSKLGSIFSKLSMNSGGSGSSTPPSADDVTFASNLHPHHEILPGVSTKLDSQLGPWRFADARSDAVEDNSFVFLDKSVSTPKRRKHFANPANRQAFVYDPEIVYSTSFFAPFCDLNTLDLKIGPVSMSLAPYFNDQPIRYTLRSTRKEMIDGVEEEEVFATVSFQLVD